MNQEAPVSRDASHTAFTGGRVERARSLLSFAFVLVISILLSRPAIAQQGKDATLWLTTPDKSALFSRQTPPFHFSKSESRLPELNGQSPVITVDDNQKFQSIEGFGFALTGGSAQLLMRMSSEARSALLKELFSVNGNGIGVSYLRVSIGSSDMNERVYSYDDLAAGETDVHLAKFSLAPDQAAVIPVLKDILAIAPNIKILASPWSAPAWMKTNDNSKGGSLKPEYYGAYAEYFVKYIQGMRAAGVPIDAITIQNEPLNPKNTPSMAMFAEQQDEFIKQDLGPALHKAGLNTRILLYDHNLDVPSYALSILKDPAASRYVAGSAFHLYGGEVSVMTQVHDAFPDKGIYFTEQSVTESREATMIEIAEPVSGVLIGATRNWSRNVLLWNLAADPNAGPHTDNGGCTECRGAITLDGDKATRLVAYYAVAHLSKFVRPGSVRIASNAIGQLDNVAFRTPGGNIVLVVSNTGNFVKKFQVAFHRETFTASLPIGAAATYVW